MQVFGWVLAALAGWTAIGIAGTLLAWATGDRRRARHSLGWIAGVWVVYLSVLFGVSAGQKQKTVPRGQEECFDGMCFSVADVMEVGEFRGGLGEGEGREGEAVPRQTQSPFGKDNQGDNSNGHAAGRLLRVGVRVRNVGGDLHGVEDLRGYLVDRAGRKWEQTPGLGGVLLTVRLPRGGVATSEPVFRVADETKVLGLVLTRERAAWRWLVIGDTDAIGHEKRRTMLLLQ